MFEQVRNISNYVPWAASTILQKNLHTLSVSDIQARLFLLISFSELPPTHRF